jgi:hypothetical protein
VAKRSISFAKHRESGSEAVRPQDVFANCMAKQRKLEKLSVRDQVQQALKDYLFIHHPLFAPVWAGRDERLCVKLAKERYPFDFSIIQRKDAQISESEWRYRQILEHLKKLENIELRLLCIARWLKQEGVCEPEDIMPSALLRRVLGQFVGKEQISMQDLHHWYLVTIWYPYFDRLLVALRAAPKTNRGPVEGLVKQGYEEAAVNAATGKRSPIPAIASWLEDPHKQLEARTLENAYSRVQAGRRKRRSVLA